jgi:hypothetical protein
MKQYSSKVVTWKYKLHHGYVVQVSFFVITKKSDGKYFKLTNTYQLVKEV